MLAVVACTRPDDDFVETRFIASPTTIASPDLAAIDSLMWRQPDSALMRLLPYFDTCRRDVACYVSPITTEYDRHYANLLLAELLYKNDCAQTNRLELLQVVAYFDSLNLTLNDTREPKRLIAGADPLSLTRNDRITFLTARAHYINGVGYYENDSMVEACREYLKALEIMEDHFEEKELVGKKAKFMTYTNNRLGDMFSEQFMMDPAIDCYKQSYDYSVISPVSSYSVSNSLYRIGKQYDKKGDKDSADYYYSQALEIMPDTINPYFRDIVSSQALLSYQLTHQAEASLTRLKQMVVLANDDERMSRYLLLGDIYFEEGQFDSARLYLEPVFAKKNDAISQMQAAEYLRVLYDSLNEKEKSDYYIHFLALHKPMEYDSDAKVSSLGEVYKNYLEKKQKQRSEKEKQEERRQTTKKTIIIIIPILIFLVSILILLVRNKQRKNILAKEEYHQKQLETKEANAREELEKRDMLHAEAIEAERKAHLRERASLSSRLKQSNQEVRDLKEQIKRQDELNATPKQAESFTDEPICQLILKRVNKGKFKSKVDYLDYKDAALSKQQLFDLRVVADQHYDLFTLRLKKAYPQLTNADLDYCCLYLLGLTDADLSALMQRAYNTIVERDGKLKKIFGRENPLPVTLMGIAKNSSSD